MTTALYVRTSTSDKQDTKMQIDELRSLAKIKELSAIKVYEDKGFTGKNMKRPSLQLLLDDIKSNKIDYLLIWKFDRLARSLQELLFMISLVDKYNVKLISLKDNIDMSTPQGRLMLHIIGAFSQFEADIIKQRVKAGVDHARRHGTKSGLPFGRKRLRNDSLIKACYNELHSYSKVASKLKIPRSTVVRSVKSI